MAAKPVFTDEQQEILHAAALRVWRKFKAEGKTQKELAFALGLSQQSVSALIKGTYRPGVKIAGEIAVLDGKELEDLIGEFAPVPAPGGGTFAPSASSPFPNLDVCIQFFASSKHWSPWTLAAARAGYFGTTDFAPPEWSGKLDHLEKALDRARRGA